MSYKKLPQEILLAGVLSVFSGATESQTPDILRCHLVPFR